MSDPRPVPLWMAVALLFAATAGKILATGPLTLSRPTTILSNGNPITQQSAPYLVFLAEARRALPEGTLVAVATPESLNGVGSLDYLIAIGQLPRCRVMPLQGSARRLGFFGNPRYVAAYAIELKDARLRVAIRLPHGTIYWVAR